MGHNIEYSIDLLIDEYSDYVFKIINNLVGDTLTYQDKEEIVADTFYLLWKNQTKINTNLKAYLAKITKNRSYDFLRKNNIEFDYKDEIYLEKEDNLDQIIYLKQSLKKLNNDEKKIFNLYYVYGYKIKEISKILMLNNSTIKIKLHRIRKKLKEEYYV